MKPWRCKHGYEIGFDPVESELGDDKITYRIKWKFCGICCNEIAERQVVATALATLGQCAPTKSE